jgi:hypothetical protein
MKKGDTIMRPGLAKSVADAGQGDRAEFKAAPRIKPSTKERGRTNMTFFMSLTTHAALKQLAYTRGVSMQQLVAEFVDKGLAEAGEETFKRQDERS